MNSLYLATIFLIFFNYENYYFKHVKARSSSIIEKANLKVKIDKRSFEKEGYGEVYKTKFDVKITLRIFGNKKSSNYFDLPVDFFRPEFLNNLNIGEVITYPDFDFELVEHEGDCYRTLVSKLNVMNVENSRIKSLICPTDQELDMKEIDLSGYTRGQFFKIGFDRTKETSDDPLPEPLTQSLSSYKQDSL